MSRYIDADALIADMQERLCKPCKDKGEDYHEVRCRACWVDDAINIVDGFAVIGIYMVRCKECKHYHELWGCTKNPNEYLVVELDDFCSRGERREP